MIAALPPHVSPYGMYDSVQSHVLKGKLQEHPHAKVGAYANGGYASDPASIGEVIHGQALWIDTNGSTPKANVLDVEPGNASPQLAGEWVRSHARSVPGSPAIIYTMRSQWATAQADVQRDGQGQQVRWWIADPTGHPHMVHGADATQWYWGADVDISAVHPHLWEG